MDSTRKVTNLDWVLIDGRRDWVAILLVSVACALLAVNQFDSTPSNSTAYLIGQVLLVQEQIQLKSFNFDFPLLPILLVLPWPDVRWVTLLCGGFHAFLMVLVLNQCRQLDLSRVNSGMVLLGCYLLPSAAGADQDLPTLLAMSILFAASTSFKRFTEKGLTHDAFQCGLLLVLACCATPAGIFAGLVLTVTHLVTGQRHLLAARVAAVLVLLFPVLALLGCYFYLSWLERGAAALNFVPTAAAPQGIWLFLAYTICILAIWPHSTRKSINHFVSAMAAAVLVLQLYTLLWTQQTMDQRIYGNTPWTERSVLNRIGQAANKSILMDTRYSTRVLAAVGSVKPFLVDGDSAFGLALLNPSAHVQHVLVALDAPGDSLLARYREQAPLGFTLEARFGRFVMYRRLDAPPLLGLL